MDCLCNCYIIWGRCCMKHISRAWISNHIPQNSVGYNYLSMPYITASDTQSPCMEGLVQERRNSSAHVLEFCLSCTNPSISYSVLSWVMLWWDPSFFYAMGLNMSSPRQNGRNFADNILTAFYWIEMCWFLLGFHLNLFIGVQLVINQKWSRHQYLCPTVQQVRQWFHSLFCYVTN